MTKSGALVTSLPDTWHYRVSTSAGLTGVSILRLHEIASLICNFCLRAAARTCFVFKHVKRISWTDLSQLYSVPH